MTTEKPATYRRLGFGKLLLISFGLWTGSYVIEQTIRWSNPLEGFVCGLFHIFFTGISWAVLILPWSLVVGGLYKAFEWQRFRSHWVLAPSIAALAFTIIGLIQSPPTARGSFSNFTKAEIPAEAKNVKYHLRGGGVSDYSIAYYFECSSESLEKLVREMQMGEERDLTAESIHYMGLQKELPNSPDPTQWVGGRIYSREAGSWDFNVITDPTKTKVYVWMWCI